MKKVIYFIKDLIIFISFFILLYGAFAFLKPFMANKSEHFNLIIEVLILLVLSLMLFVIYHKKLINDFKSLKREDITKNIKVFVTSLFVMYIFNFVISFLVNGIASNEEANREVLASYPIISFIQMGFLAPFYEEILFRLNFKNLFKNKIVFSLITGIGFGLMHVIAADSLIQLLYVIPYSAMGFGLGYIFFDTDNIFASMFFHAFNNISLILFLFVAGVI